MRIRAFLVRRAVIILPVIFGVCFATFMLIRIGDRDPAASLAGPMATPEEIQQVRSSLDLDKPLLIQFTNYLGLLVRGDLGKSWQSGLPIVAEIADRLPITLELVIVSIFLASLIGIPAGLHAAMNPNGMFDHFGRIFSSLFYSIPTYWLSLMAIFLLFFKAGIAPPPLGRLPIDLFPPPRISGSFLLDGLIAGDFSIVRAQLFQMFLPVLCFGLGAAAPIFKQTRAIAIEVMASDYIKLATAYGLQRSTIAAIALRNSFVPVITFIGSELSGFLAAASLIELIFSWGGLGQWGLNAILASDFAAVQGYVLVLSLFSIVVFLVVDLLVLVIEPRASRQ